MKNISEMQPSTDFTPGNTARNQKSNPHKYTAIKENKKKGIALGLIAAVTIGGITTAVVHNKSVAADSDSSNEATATDTVEKKDIEKTTTVTGTIASSETSTENAGVTDSYPVASVNVKVGDTVKAGDVLYTLDMTSVESDLKTQQATLAAQNSSNQSSIAAANRSVADAVASANAANDKASTDVTNAQADVSTAQTTLDNAKNTLSAAQTAEANAQAAYQANTDDAALKDAYDTAVSNRQSAEEAVSTAESNLTSAQRSLTSAQSDQSSTAATGQSTVAQQQDAVVSAKNDASTSNLTTQEAIAKDQEALTKQEVKATMDGTVTNVNVAVGQSYSGTGGVVISNTGSLIASANVDEAVISQIKEGMKVYITTEATGDTKLTGIVSFVSPTATKNSGSTSSDSSSSDSSDGTSAVSTTRATYRVDVTLDDTNEDLRLGMTAKMNFVLDSAEDTLVVPSADISTDDDGNSYVTVISGSNEKKVAVTTGVSNDYYTAVTSKQLKAGDEILMGTGSSSDGDLLEGMY